MTGPRVPLITKQLRGVSAVCELIDSLAVEEGEGEGLGPAGLFKNTRRRGVISLGPPVPPGKTASKLNEGGGGWTGGPVSGSESDS